MTAATTPVTTTASGSGSDSDIDIDAASAPGYRKKSFTLSLVSSPCVSCVNFHTRYLFVYLLYVQCTYEYYVLRVYE